MKVTVNHRPLVMVFLNSDGHRTRFADARRLREWALDTARQSNTAGQVNAKPDHG
jgi:D-alanyl-D-alanine carboxypeptidase